MKLLDSLLCLTASASTIHAFPSSADSMKSNIPRWHPPRHGDARSPCPGLNSLANHDMIPHNGKGITLANVMSAFSRIGLDPPIAMKLFQTVDQNGLLKNNHTTLDLDALNVHGKLEHDGSLSRADASTGNAVSFNATVFKEFLSALDPKSDLVTIEDMSRARAHRVSIEKARDRNITFTQKEEFSGHNEASTIIAALGGAAKAETRLEFLKIVFEQERFPFKEGWQPNSPPLTAQEFIGVLAREIKADPGATVQFPPPAPPS